MYGTTGDPFADTAALEYDSGWIDIIEKRGQYFNITHNLNITDVTDIIFDMTGKVTINSEPHHNEYNPSVFNATVSGWNQIYRGTAPAYAQSVIQTTDGGYAIVGYTGTFSEPLEIDALLIKTDAEGSQLWNQTYGETIVDFAYSVVQTSPDGGYAVAGHNTNGAWLIKTDAEGNHLWNQTYGESDFDFDEYARSVVQTTDGGYALAGYTWHWAETTGYDIWLVKTDAEGNHLWNQTYGRDHDMEECYGVIQTTDGGYALAGNYLLIKTDAEGNHLWNNTYGTYTYSVIQTTDGGYALAGGYGDAVLIKTDVEGNHLWTQKFGGPNSDEVYSVVQTSDGAYVVTGFTMSFGTGDLPVWLIKTYGSEEAPATEQLWLAWTLSTPNTITLYRGEDDPYWNYVRVRIWTIKDPS